MPEPENTETARPERAADARSKLATLERELAEARKELDRREGVSVELQRELVESRGAADALRTALADREAALEAMRVELAERDRTIEHLRAELGRRDTAPLRALTRGSLVTMRARHRLHFSVGAEAVCVDAGKTFLASLADLEGEHLVAGADFDVLT